MVSKSSDAPATNFELTSSPVNPLGFTHLKPTWKLYTIYAVSSFLKFSTHSSTNYIQVWIFLEFVFVCFMYIETRGPTLEEIAKIIDGDDHKKKKIMVADIVVMHPGRDDKAEREGMRTVRYEDVKLDPLSIGVAR